MIENLDLRKEKRKAPEPAVSSKSDDSFGDNMETFGYLHSSQEISGAASSSVVVPPTLDYYQMYIDSLRRPRISHPGVVENPNEGMVCELTY